MKEQEIIENLEQRVAAAYADLSHYKRANAGLKGRNKQLSEELKSARESLISLEERMSACQMEASAYKEEIENLKQEALLVNANLVWYYHLPWWKRSKKVFSVVFLKNK